MHTQKPEIDFNQLDPQTQAELKTMLEQKAVTEQVVDNVIEELSLEPDSPKAPVASKPVNYQLQVPYSQALQDDEFDYGDSETAFMPSGTVRLTTEKIKDLPKTEIASSQEGKEWLGVISAGIESNVYDEGLIQTVLDETAQFVQGVDSEMGKLTASSPSFKAQEGTKFTGEKARLRVRQSLKLGVIFNVPLWHSGFWVRIKAPSEGDLLELYRQITADKVTLGRATYGLLFSNNTSYASRTLLDFCIEHLYETSLDLKEADDIRPHIKTPDLPILFWGLACSIWPNGFQYMRGCIADPEKCTHVIKEKLDLSKLQFTNTSALTKWQIAHMTKRTRGAMSLESLKRYNEEFIKGQPRKIQLNPQVSMTLKLPNAIEHIDAGYRWINAIEENYGRALIQDESKRDAYLLSQGKATVMRQYSHFVEAIDVSGELYEDRETIEDILNDLTASDTLRTEFMQAVAKYLDDSVVSLIAIPSFQCPSCGGEQKSSKDAQRYPELIPLDVNNTFFTLAVQRIRRIEAR